MRKCMNTQITVAMMICMSHVSIFVKNTCRYKTGRPFFVANSSFVLRTQFRAFFQLRLALLFPCPDT